MQKRLWIEYSGSTSWRGAETHTDLVRVGKHATHSLPPRQRSALQHSHFPVTYHNGKMLRVLDPIPSGHRPSVLAWKQGGAYPVPGLSGKASSVLCHLPPVFLAPLCPSLANRCVYSQYRKVRSSLYRTAMADDRQIKKTLRVMPSSNGEDRSPLCERREMSSDSEGPDGRAANWKRDISSGWVHVT